MNKNLDIIIFSHSLGFGGIGRTVSDVSCNLPPYINQTIVLLDDTVAYPYRGHLIVLGKDSLKHLPVRGLRLFLNVVKFQMIIRKIKPDIVLAFHYHARTINCLAQMFMPTFRYASISAALGVPSQFQQHYADSGSWMNRSLNFLVQKHSNKIIACSEGVKSSLVNHFKAASQKIEVIYSPVDVKRIIQMSAETVNHPWFHEKIPILITSGRLIPEKNQADLVKAFALIRKERSCRLVILGDGTLKDDLVSLARELEVHDDVLFLGFQKNPFKYISKSTVFVFPSIMEGLGLSLIEAMIVGCPTVATDCPVGPREILAPGTVTPERMDDIEEAQYGLLIPVGNVGFLKEAIEKLLDDGRLRGKYSCVGVERAMIFDIERIAPLYAKLIVDVVYS